MNFLQMAINNMKRKSENYLTYFLSTTFAVVIFFIFCAIYNNPELAVYHQAGKKMEIIFRIGIIAVLLFSSVFVHYANSLFIKERKKEIAIYSLLGMKKKEIGLLLFLETLFVGLAAVICGVLLGSLFARLLSLALIKLILAGAPGNSMGFQLTPYPFVLSICLFMILFLINAISSCRMIYRSKLIDLLSAEKEGEVAPEFSGIAALFSVVLIGASYFLFLQLDGNAGGMQIIKPSMLACVLLAIGTFLLFHNIVIWVLSKCKKVDQIYFKTGNFISVSQLVYRIKANSNLFSAISLLSAFTISIMSAVIAFYIVLLQIMPVYNPFSYLCENLNEETRAAVIKTVEKDEVAKLDAMLEYQVLTSKASQKDYRVDTNSRYGKITLNVGDEFDIDLLKLSDYQAILTATHARLKKGNMGGVEISSIPLESCIFLDGNYDDTYSKDLIGKGIQVNTDDGLQNLKIEKVSLHKYMGSAHGRTTLVLNDEDYTRFFSNTENYGVMNFLGFHFTNPLETESLYQELNEMLPRQNHDLDYLACHQDIFSIYGSYIFVGLFLGLLFLMAAGSIIFYKQLMEAKDDQKRYEILRKVGMTRKEVLHSVCRQLGAIFMIPFSVAVIHSIVILRAFQNLVYTIATDIPIFLLTILVVIVFMIIYGVFYVLAVKGYMKTVWRKSSV